MKNQKGSSLVEVVVAMVILALLITGLNTCILAMINSNVSSKELSFATSNAYSLFEQLRRIDYNSVNSNSDIVSNKYLRSWTVTTDIAQKKINLNIYWPTTTQKHRIELSTIIAHP